ncbi:MAG: polysaccharide deacetylase family protein [Bacteroidales bacterium]|nr:polysaccharide deacetylase family protein [Bacteroidales bacterium]
MRSICFYFQVHQPFRLRTYRFFDIGASHHYYDEYQNRSIVRRVAERSYIPMNNLLLGLIKEYGAAFRVSFSISGIALDQFEMYAPEALASFKKLASTGNVEFLAETYAHSLAAMKDPEEFKSQVRKHADRIEQLFGVRPTAFRNTELIYSDYIGSMVYDLGYNLMLTEGAKHILGWKSPNFLYCSGSNPKLKLLLRNYQLSDDIAFRFSNQSWIEWPLTAEKFSKWLNTFDKNQPVVNIFLDYESFGEHQWAETGIFEFMKALPKQVFANTGFKFGTPSQIASKLQPVAAVNVPHPISWADEERDLTAWLGNEMQDEAFESLYNLAQKVRKSKNMEIQKDWLYLQTSDHFYYMCTKWFSDGAVHKYFNPYSTPYEAFINYMNILSDFIGRVDRVNEQVEDEVETYNIPDPASYLKKPAKALSSSVKKPETKKVPGKDAGSKSVSKPVIGKNSKIVEGNFNILFDLSKKDLKSAIEKIDIKDLAFSLIDKAEDEIGKLKKNLPATYHKELSRVMNELGKPRKATVEAYRTKIGEMLKSLF